MRVGVIGGGQLAWMMIPASRKLGIELCIQTPKRTDPVGTSISSENIILAAVDDADATATLAQRCNVITFENEFVDLNALGQLAKTGAQFYPQIGSLQPLLDKYHQRQYFQRLDIPTPQFAVIDRNVLDDFHQAPQDSENSGALFACLASTQHTQWAKFPMVLKARRHGYDGKGTHIVTDEATLAKILAHQSETAWLAEEFVPFERELAVMAARSSTGAMVVYPVVETQQEQQVCRRVFTVPHLDRAVQQQVEAIAHTLLTHLDFVGVLGIEFFLTLDGQVLVNEIAPRTHNSGHYTIDACQTSQFEQQLRAVTGLPLGSTDLTCAAAVMVNLLGYEASENAYQEQRQKLAALPHTQVYWYGKSICRPGRKMGHVTAVVPYGDAKREDGGIRGQLAAIANLIEGIWYSDRHIG